MMRKAALTIQKYWRGYKPRQRYIVIRQGYLRLQAAVRSRLLRFSFVKLRTRVVGLQVSCETLKSFVLKLNVPRIEWNGIL